MRNKSIWIIRTFLVFSALLVTAVAQSQSQRIQPNQLFNEEAKRNLAEKTASDARREREMLLTLEREKRAIEQEEREYEIARKNELDKLKAMPPDEPGTQSALDLYRCNFPPSAIRPPAPNAVNDCLNSTRIERERLAQKAELERKREAEEERIRERAIKLREEARLQAEAERKAAEEAAEKARIDHVMRVSGGLLGVLAVMVTIFRQRNLGWPIIVIATVMGLCSGLLLYVEVGLVFQGLVKNSLMALIVFFGGWIISFRILTRNILSVSRLLSRGFLLGAAEWLLLIPVAFLFSGKLVAEAASAGKDAAFTAGTLLGGGLVTFISGGLAFGMAILCLIAYAVTYFMTREMKPEHGQYEANSAGYKTCPHCAEMIKNEAIKCRYCGSELILENSAT